MDKNSLIAHFLSGAKEYMVGIPDADAGAIKRDVEAILNGDLNVISTKKLKEHVRELIVGHHRITYFKIGSDIYFVRGFRKKSVKTPKNEIDYAKKIYKQLKNKI
ncbi:MAG TPA: type II toxin-antitoxin system RelE/ParE family toxin [Candidatus Paceibacterota bacterium]